MVKLRRITLYRILPIILISVLLFSICICSNVFSPKPARAIIGEEFIIPAFNGFMNAMNIYLSTDDLSDEDTQYLSNGVWNTLVSVANSQNWLSSAAWTLATLAAELSTRITPVVNNIGERLFQIDYETSTLFDHATRQFIIDNSLSSDISTPVIISTDTGYRFSNGAPLTFADSDWNGGTQLSDIYYTGNSGQQFKLILKANTGYFFVDENNADLFKLGASQPFYTINYYKFQLYNASSVRIKIFDPNGYNFKTSQVSYANMNILFGNQVTTSYQATTGTIVQNPDMPDESEDESGYISVPPQVGWGASTTGMELLQSMLDYERDKPYSSTSEYAYTISNEIPIQPEPEKPGMVELPLIGIQLPINFSLNLRGIWYYVVQWVNSIRSWFTWMFGVFANLPYAMVVPIYATAVVVIVLGVYKRFFM